MKANFVVRGLRLVYTYTYIERKAVTYQNINIMIFFLSPKRHTYSEQVLSNDAQ